MRRRRARGDEIWAEPVFGTPDTEPVPSTPNIESQRHGRERRESATTLAALALIAGCVLYALFLITRLGDELEDMRAKQEGQGRILGQLAAQEPEVMPRYLVFVSPCSQTATVMLSNESGDDVWQGDLTAGVTAASVNASLVQPGWKLQVARDDGWIMFELGSWLDDGVAVVPAVACPAGPP